LTEFVVPFAMFSSIACRVRGLFGLVGNTIHIYPSQSKLFVSY